MRTGSWFDRLQTLRAGGNGSSLPSPDNHKSRGQFQIDHLLFLPSHERFICCLPMVDVHHLRAA
jgi:hypothetical protein